MGDSPISTTSAPPRRLSLAKRVRIPALSGKASAAYLVLCLAVTAILIPMALRLPRWIDFEIVVAVWWAIWLGVLTWLLYTGQRVADDHQLREPRNWFTWDGSKPRGAGSSWGDGFFWGWSCAGDAILIVIGLIVLVGAIWFLFEIAIPVILFLLYFVARGMVAQVVNDRCRCPGRLACALAWGLLWATVYTAPLAAAVWFVHYVHQHARADGHGSQVPLGKETTYVTGPVDKDGYIDYQAALNNLLGKGITPEKNANVLLWKAFGPRPQGERMHVEYFKWLGIEEPPPQGDYFVGLDAYVKEHLKPNEIQVRALEDQLDQAAQRIWTANECPHLAEWLKANEKPLALVVQASRRPDYYNPLVSPQSGSKSAELVGAPLSGVHKSRELGKALAVRAMLRAGASRLDDAWQDLLACRRLGRLVARGGTLIETLVGIAIGQMSNDAIPAYVEQPGLTFDQLRAAFLDLQTLAPLSPVADKMDITDRFMHLDYVQNVRRWGTGKLERLMGISPARQPDAMERFGFASVDWGTALRVCNHWYDRIAATLRIRDRTSRQREIDRFVIDLRALKKETTDIAGLRKELAGGAPAGQALGKKLGTIFVFFMIPAFKHVQDAADRDEQMHRNVHLAFALAIYKHDRRRYPAKLDELLPKYLPAIPDDLFSGKAINYRPSEKGYLLYSVGVNGLDDDGRGPDDDPAGDDLRLRMPVPKVMRKGE